jgi:histidinol-phosphatase (PHP family)
MLQTMHIEETIQRYVERNEIRTLASPALMDYHVHDNRSRDAPNATIEGYIKRAEQMGIKEIAFTTHLRVSDIENSTSIKPNEIDTYLNDIWRAQETTEIVLKTGFEVDYIPKDERKIAHLIEEYDLDYVLGSVHEVDGINIATGNSPEPFFNHKSLTEAIDEYYRLWQMAIESEIFDTMSHPDYFRKFKKTPIYWKDYGGVVYNAIDSLKSYGVGYEINTSGYRHGIYDKFPCDEFIWAATKAGVKTVTLGSDSHIVDTIGYRVKESAVLLEEMGYKSVSTFNARREHTIPLKKVIGSK